MVWWVIFRVGFFPHSHKLFANRFIRPIIHGVMVKVLGCGIVVSEFELKSRYYVHFRTNTIWKGINHLILLIGHVGRVLVNDPEDLGSIPRCVIPKTLKMVLVPLCLTLSNIRYILRVKWRNPGKGLAPSPTLVAILVTLDYGRLKAGISLILSLHPFLSFTVRHRVDVGKFCWSDNIGACMCWGP